MQALAAIDVEGVPPTSHVLDARNVWREDRVEPSLPPETVLGNAPDARSGNYRVPRFVGEGETE
jgi:aspartyl-tRNA(Asn)/glutamyl-tRNA(Gln) amidotransferase subunit C